VQGSVGLSLCISTQPRDTRFANRFGDSVCEATRGPNPRYEAYKAARTLAEAEALGAKREDLPYDYARGILRRGPCWHFASRRSFVQNVQNRHARPSTIVRNDSTE
jgi:hypothetical protein